MAHEFPSEDWIKTFQTQLNDNEEYAEAASDWGVDFNGDFIFTIEADDLYDQTEHYFVGLEAGECTDAYHVENPDDEDYGFVYSGPYSNWKEMVNGNIGAIDGMMSGQFSLDGDMQKVLQASDAAAALVETSASIETDFKA
jgi:putative sterol carrier protein